MKKVLSLALSGVAIVSCTTAISAVSAAPASASGCAVSAYEFKAYNHNCSWAKHYNVVKGERKYAKRATPRSYSRQSVCWANSTGYGAASSGRAVNWF